MYITQLENLANLGAAASVVVRSNAGEVRRNVVVNRQHLAYGGDGLLEDQGADLLGGRGARAEGLVAIAIRADALDHVRVKRDVLAIVTDSAEAPRADAAVDGGQVVPGVARGAGLRGRARTGEGKVAVLGSRGDLEREARVAAVDARVGGPMEGLGPRGKGEDERKRDGEGRTERHLG